MIRALALGIVLIAAVVALVAVAFVVADWARLRVAEKRRLNPQDRMRRIRPDEPKP